MIGRGGARVRWVRGVLGPIGNTARRRRSRGNAVIVIALMAVAALVGLRLALPSLARRYANDRLSHLQGYRGRVDRVSLRLWRGAYTVHGFKLEKIRGAEAVPFLTAEVIDLSIDWGAAFRGSLVAEVDISRPTVNAEPQAATVETAENLDKSGDAVVALMPLKINRLTVRDGELRFRDRRSEPEIAVRLSGISVAAENLRNARGSADRLPAAIGARATAFETGTLTVALDLDPLAASPTFLMRSTLQGVKLVALNDLLEAYAKFRVKNGVLSLYAEVAAKDGAYAGYVKPIIRDLEIEKKQARGVLKKLWAHLVAAAGAALANPAKDQVATRVPLEGKFGEADAEVWVAVGGLLKNAFIKALTPSLDHSVRFGDAQK